MATLLDRFKALLTKNQQSTNEAYNRAIYNYLGDTLVWNPENDDTFINKGYRYNSTVYAIVNLITKAASTIPFCRLRSAKGKRPCTIQSAHLELVRCLGYAQGAAA